MIERTVTGNQLEALRRQHGIQRAAFSRWAEVSYSTVCKWERDKHRLPPSYAVKLLMAYISKVEAQNGKAAETAGGNDACDRKAA